MRHSGYNTHFVLLYHHLPTRKQPLRSLRAPGRCATAERPTDAPGEERSDITTLTTFHHCSDAAGSSAPCPLPTQGLLRNGPLACAHPPHFTAKRLGTAQRGRQLQKTVNGQENLQPEPRTSQQVGQVLKHPNFGHLHPGLNQNNHKVTRTHLRSISFLASAIFNLRCRCSQQLNVQREGGKLCSHLPKAST